MTRASSVEVVKPDPVDVVLAEIARRVRAAAEQGQWVTFELRLKAGRPDVVTQTETVRVTDLPTAA